VPAVAKPAVRRKLRLEKPRLETRSSDVKPMAVISQMVGGGLRDIPRLDYDTKHDLTTT
jgi:hypothetical protein